MFSSVLIAHDIVQFLETAAFLHQVAQLTHAGHTHIHLLQFDVVQVVEGPVVGNIVRSWHLSILVVNSTGDKVILNICFTNQY